MWQACRVPWPHWHRSGMCCSSSRRTIPCMDKWLTRLPTHSAVGSLLGQLVQVLQVLCMALNAFCGISTQAQLNVLDSWTFEASP